MIFMLLFLFCSVAFSLVAIYQPVYLPFEIMFGIISFAMFLIQLKEYLDEKE